MAGRGLQEVDQALLASLHASAMQLGQEARRRLGGDWREGLAGEAHVAATLAGMRVSTQLMEAMSWLLTAQAVAVGERDDPGPAVWRLAAAATPEPATAGFGKLGSAPPAVAATAPAPLPAGIAELAAAVDRLYRRIVQLDTEVR